MNYNKYTRKQNIHFSRQFVLSNSVIASMCTLKKSHKPSHTQSVKAISEHFLVILKLGALLTMFVFCFCLMNAHTPCLLYITSLFHPVLYSFSLFYTFLVCFYYFSAKNTQIQFVHCNILFSATQYDFDGCGERRVRKRVFRAASKCPNRKTQ